MPDDDVPGDEVQSPKAEATPEPRKATNPSWVKTEKVTEGLRRNKLLGRTLKDLE